MGNFEKTQISPDGIGTILKNRRLTVPAYQRSYSWEKQNVAQFITDILGAFDRGDKEYFLGTIVLVQKSGQVEIVDGQQRLATTQIFLAVLRDYLKGKGDQRRANLIEDDYLYSTDIKTLDESFHLKLNSSDNTFFEKCIKDTRTKTSKTDSRPAKLMFEASKEIWKHIDALEVNDPKLTSKLMDILEYIQDHVVVVAITVSDTANAFAIFETLNDRGLDLSIADLLKNHLFGLSDDKIEEAKESWIKIVATLGSIGDESLLPKFIHYYWMSTRGVISQNGLFGAIKDKIQLKSDAMLFLQQLSESAKHFVSMQNPSDSRWATLGEATSEDIRSLGRIPLEQAKPLLLAVVINFSDAQLPKSLKSMVSWSVRFHVAADTRTGQFRDKLSLISQKVHNKDIRTVKELKKALEDEKILPNNSDFEKEFAQITPQPTLARYLLADLEVYKRKKDKVSVGLTPNPSPDEVNLEHILPRTITDLSDWPAFSEDSASNYLGRLGNLAIYPSKENSRIGNVPFDDKKKEFAKSSFVTTSEITKYSTWDQQAIEDRQAELAKLASKAWPLEY